jgi:hypothetical protein
MIVTPSPDARLVRFSSGTRCGAVMTITPAYKNLGRGVF